MKKTVDLKAALKQLSNFQHEFKRPPSYEEIRKLLGYKSKNAAYWVVNKLKEAGVVESDSAGKLRIPTFEGLKLLGTVQAGFPSPAEEELVDVMNLNDYLVKHPDQTYLIRVSGDSMEDAGIHEGDLVVVERGRLPQVSDIVIAQVDGDWTMKYYQKEKGNVILEPANKKYPTIRPTYELTIGGVVTGVIRRYK